MARAVLKLIGVENIGGMALTGKLGGILVSFSPSSPHIPHRLSWD
jgi:hypothetical protein